MARIKNMKNAKKIENPGVLLKRLMGYIMKHYGAAFVTVLICILISVICNVQGTMFMQTLIGHLFYGAYGLPGNFLFRAFFVPVLSGFYGS